MKVSKLKETANILLDLQILLERYDVKDVVFEILSETVEIYGTHEFLLILEDNFTGTIENYKFVIEL